MNISSPFRNAIRRQVRDLRRSNKWTRATMAHEATLLGWNLSRARIANIEDGRARVSDHELRRFAELFVVPLEELFPAATSDRAYETLRNWLTSEYQILRKDAPAPLNR